MKKIIILALLLGNSAFGSEIRVMTSSQIFHSLGAVTGLNLLRYPSVSKEYEESKSSFPRKGTTDEVNSKFKVKLFRLSWKVCEALYEKELKKGSMIFNGVNLSEPLSNHKVDQLKELGISFAAWFWDSTLSEDEARIAMEEIHSISLLPLKIEEGYILACSGFLVSPNFYTF
ncbi:MAG: hypothetical protein CL678_03055 [Bdellovibrionaceae bacterium]|nr:hypothetical protein [Pseudobdellovibrionaceae bacterium]|tara:strand:+ start:368 stop:886 length:519 start_codon:yes stop_codon:yes gene_type:complete